MSDSHDPHAHLSPDERAALRAWLQRNEVRLSTIHRVGSALLSGAGVMVLLPPLAKDSIVTVINGLTQGSVGLSRVLLLTASVLVLALPIVAFWLMLRDMTRFYFHAQALRSGGQQLFLPRFTLTALKLPFDELDRQSQAALETARRDPATVELLVPTNEARAGKVDKRLAGYGIHTGDSDLGRADGLFALAASHQRTLIEEVAKLEYGMARHVLRIQIVVLRYLKALISFIFTAIAVFTMAAIESRVDGVISRFDEVWLAAVMAVWAAGVALAVAAPVRWVEQIMLAEGATRLGVANDTDLTRVERVATGFGLAVWVLSVAAIYSVLLGEPVGVFHSVAVSVVAAISGGALAWHVFKLQADRSGVEVTERLNVFRESSPAED